MQVPFEEEQLQRVIKQVAGATLNVDEPQRRPTVLHTRAAALELEEIAQLALELDSRASGDVECAILFIMLLHQYAMEESDLQRDKLLQLIRKQQPGLADALGRMKNVDEDKRPAVLAKISLTLEVHYLLNQELEDAAIAPEQISGSDTALSVLAGRSPGDLTLRLDSNSFATQAQEILTEVLEELDFIRKGKTNWEFRLVEEGLGRYEFGGNLQSYARGSGMMSPLAMSRMAENLVKRLSFIIRSTSMYPAGHPAIEPALTSFMGMLEQLHRDEPLVTISAMGNELMVNDMEIRRRGKVVDSFLAAMADRNASSLSFHAGVDLDSVIRFANVFNKSPQYIKNHGGLSRLMERRSVTGVTCDQFRYALVSKDGQVVMGAEPPEERAIENLIFGELIERLERGDSLRDLSSEQLGEALKSVLQGTSEGVESKKSLLANFIATIDPTILERGLLSRRDIQRDMSWSAVRRIVKARIKDLASANEDARLEALERLMSLALTAVERNKDNTVLQILENVSAMLSYEINPDALYSAVVLLGTVCGMLIERGKLSAADTAAQGLESLREQDMAGTDLVSSRRRALAEAMRRMDTPETGERLVDALLSYNEVVSEEAETLAARVPMRNLTWRLMEVFLEPDIHTRARAYRILKNLGGPAGKVMVARLRRLRAGYETPRDLDTGRLEDGEWYIARNAVEIIGEIGDRDAIPVLESLCNDPDDRLRATALRSLYGVSPAEAATIALKKAGDASEEVASVALEILGKRPDEAEMSVEELVRLFRLRPDLRAPVMNVIRRIPDSGEVLRLAVDSFDIQSGVPMGSLDLAMDALDYIRRYGSSEDVPVLEGYMERNSKPGLLKKRGDEQVIAGEIRKAIREMS